MTAQRNLDEATVRAFGEEWAEFDQSTLAPEEATRLFGAYFSVFPWDALPQDAVGADIGCGSGRWARHVAPRVGTLHCIDASRRALAVARRNLAGCNNCIFRLASLDELGDLRGTLDFGYALGVLHHLPDPAAGLRASTALLKPGAPFLLYVYYALENRPLWFRFLWRTTDAARKCIAGLPFALKRRITDLIALLVYWPCARVSALAAVLGVNSERFPLSFLRNASFYTMRTDALDRFGTRIEKRFSRSEIAAMMADAGLDRIVFSEEPPYWCAVGRRKAQAPQ